MRETTGLKYKQLIEIFTSSDLRDFPTLLEIRNFLQAKAGAILGGGIEYCPSKEWLNIYWPPDEFCFIKLVRDGKLDKFYAEATEALLKFMTENKVTFDPELLKESILLNQALIKLPFQTEDLELKLSYNIFEFCNSVRRMEKIRLIQEPVLYKIDRATQRWDSWDDWFRLVVWYGNKKGAYLYGSVKTDREIAGHF